jgi:hypothetical protein
VPEGPSPDPQENGVARIRKDTAAVKSKPGETKPEVAKSTERQKAPIVETADSAGRPSIPRGPVRAQFLGTTPDGNLIFGVPGSEKISVAPPASGGPGEKPRRQTGPSPTPGKIDGRPVLPALPVDR